MLKKDYQDQRDHLGAHLKNSVSKVYQITDGILQICQYARKGKLGKGRSFKEIEKLALELRHWNDVPANISYKFSPLGVMDKEEEWNKEKVKSNKFMLSKDDADNKIYPTIKDIKNVLVG
tara:strand:+ start:8366 stop:8725 length:360 start_codon:yes stop_codon:yes gene_type:complete